MSSGNHDHGVSHNTIARLGPRVALLAVLALLTGWALFLRWPTFAATLWNVDEAIHAAVARMLLDGGVLYRDAVDQRTPLTYYAVALLFRLFGENNLWALRAAVAVMIGVTAYGLFLLGRRHHGFAAGAWAALIFCALTTDLFYYVDGNAVNTEWFVILFTIWATWWFWRVQDRVDIKANALVGALFGLAFLAKQPALLDLGAPLLTLLYLAGTRRCTWAAAARAVGGLLAGFGAVAGTALLYFIARGAWGSLLFYTWTYNLRYYSADITPLDRGMMALVPFNLLLAQYPIVLLALLGGIGLMLVRLVQLRPTPPERNGHPWAVYLLAWNVTSLAAAAASGRRFEHYYIQCLPAFTLSAGGALAEAGALVWQRWVRGRPAAVRTMLVVAPLALFVAAAGLEIVAHPLAGRWHTEYPRDPAMAASRFIHRLTLPAERIFVWGYNPDIYLYADRKPASRFLYCSFQTGLIPWTNIAPGKDTRYAIVPGAMATLLDDLEARRPTFIVDCGVGPHRNFSKYPLRNFAPLAAFVSRYYVETDSAQFLAEGFCLHLIKDSARREPVGLAGGPAGRPRAPLIFGPPLVGPVPTAFLVAGEDPDGRLQRLELRVGNAVADSVSFQPTARITVQFQPAFDRLGPGEYHLTARAISANGATRDSAAFTVVCSPSAVPADRLPAFALPWASKDLLPLTVRSPYPPASAWEEGRRVISIHAPSTLSYPVGSGAARVRGGFGIRPGAYAPENPTPTDGAEFQVDWVAPGGERRVLFHRWLQPRDHPGDRPMQFFTADLPPQAGGGHLEFVITPGPMNNTASDWTYWADLELETSH